jgi:hypothetical protein
MPNDHPWQIKPSSGLTSVGRKKRKPATMGQMATVPPERLEVVFDEPEQPPSQDMVAQVTQQVLAALTQQVPANRVEDRGHMVTVRSEPKGIVVGGEEFATDAPTLMRMIRQVTQTIGEYKHMDNIYSRYVIPALRKARSDIVSDLERHFGIKWELNTQGHSVFFT